MVNALQEQYLARFTADDVCEGFVHMLRRTAGHVVTRSVTSTSGLLLPAALDRVSFIVSQPSTGTLTLNFGEPAVSGSGFQISSTGTTAPFSIWDFGSLVTLPVYGILSAAGPATVLIAVTMLQCRPGGMR